MGLNSREPSLQPPRLARAIPQPAPTTVGVITEHMYGRRRDCALFLRYTGHHPRRTDLSQGRHGRHAERMPTAAGAYSYALGVSDSATPAKSTGTPFTIDLPRQQEGRFRSRAIPPPEAGLEDAHHHQQVGRIRGLELFEAGESRHLRRSLCSRMPSARASPTAVRQPVGARR